MTKMAKLIIAELTEDKPVKVTLELPPSIHRDLVGMRKFWRGLKPEIGDVLIQEGFGV
jgi:hypothetical protein